MIIVLGHNENLDFQMLKLYATFCDQIQNLKLIIKIKTY